MTPSPQQQWEETIGDILMNLAMNSAISRNRNERPVSEALQTINKAVADIVIGNYSRYAIADLDMDTFKAGYNQAIGDILLEQRTIVGGES